MNSQNEVTNREQNVPERVQNRRALTPLVDIYENNEELLLFADMPGVEQDGVNVRFERNQLTLEGNFRYGEDGEAQEYVFTRTFAVPGGIDPDRITAALRNGVLTLHLPKHDRLRPRRISVTSA